MTSPDSYVADTILLKLWRIGSAGVHAAIIAYGVLFILYLLARLTIGERLGLVALANNVLPWLCWVGMALAVVGLFYRDRWLLLALQLPAVVMFGIAYGDRFLPKTPPPESSGPALTVVMYNVCG